MLNTVNFIEGMLNTVNLIADSEYCEFYSWCWILSELSRMMHDSRLLKYRKIFDARYKILEAWLKIPEARFKILDARFKILDAKFKYLMKDSKYGLKNSKYWLKVPTRPRNLFLRNYGLWFNLLGKNMPYIYIYTRIYIYISFPVQPHLDIWLNKQQFHILSARKNSM